MDDAIDPARLPESVRTSYQLIDGILEAAHHMDHLGPGDFDAIDALRSANNLFIRRCERGFHSPEFQLKYSEFAHKTVATFRAITDPGTATARADVSLADDMRYLAKGLTELESYLDDQSR